MVVSVDSQKILKKKRHYRGRKVSSYSSMKRSVNLRRTPVSLYFLPFISALFVFSIYINVSDIFWRIKTPEMTLHNFILPDDAGTRNKENRSMRAFVDIPFPENPQMGSFHPEGVFYLSSYIVRDEDRYSILAEKFNITLDSLLSVNHIDSSSLPTPGNEIKIPNISGIYYKVLKGDTLTSISIKFNLDLQEIIYVNQMFSSVIHPGEELFLPEIIMDKDKINKLIQGRFTIPSAGSVKNNYGSSIDPTTGLKNYSYGIDIINSRGTAVYAAKAGIVKNTSYNSYFGRVVLLNHSGSFQSMYGCLDRIVVEPGQVVARGELLGYIGNSGFKAYEHLQFSIFKDKEDVDTLEYIF